MILANGCNITKSEQFKGVWILSVSTVCSKVSQNKTNQIQCTDINKKPYSSIKLCSSSEMAVVVVIGSLFNCSRNIWCVRHFGTVNLTPFSIIMNEYSKIYKHITSCCRCTHSRRSKVCWPFQKWQMACVMQPIETVANETSTYIYIYIYIYIYMAATKWLPSNTETKRCV